MTTPSKTMRTDMGRYPGGVNYLTDKDIQDSKIEMTTGNNTNGRIQVSLTTRTIDQDYVNKYQFVWLDTKEDHKPKFLNIQSLNYELVSFCHPRHAKEKQQLESAIKEKGSLKNVIVDRFKLFGVIANNDVDNNYDDYMVRNPRGLTFTIWGTTHVLDYWSNKKHGRVSGYTTCYFVLKMVKVSAKDLYQRMLTSGSMNTGVFPVDVDWGKDDEVWAWQVVPYHNNKQEIDLKELVCESWSKDKKKKYSHIAHYWKVGHIHEYPQNLMSTSQYQVRKSGMEVSKNMSYLHMQGQVVPMQFYMDISSDNLLF
jgi:hypothetical protein